MALSGDIGRGINVLLASPAGYEDRWFYQHPGINPFALLRAAWLNLRHDRIVSGGSTLSMQVARIIEPHSRTFQGKLRQIWRTLQLEWHYSKDAILEIYLNRAPFGGTLEGDRKSTRLNSSHVRISYAVFCLKKKK